MPQEEVVTKTQRTVLEWYRALADMAPRKTIEISPRTRSALMAQGFLEQRASERHGPTFHITQAGRAALSK
jgi:hypothetical protein